MRPKLEGMTRRIVPVAIALLLMVAASAAAETKVLTIYFHGTGSGLHSTFVWPGATGEFYMRDSAHDFGKIIVPLPCPPIAGLSHLVFYIWTEGGHSRYKYTVDGFATPACVPEGIDPDKGPRNWDVATYEGVSAIRAAMAVNGDATWVLNLVGHSRGGVLALTVANAAATLSDISPKIEKINILAYDPVPGSADPIRRLGASFVLSPKVRQYVGVYVKHHMQFAFEPIIPTAADPSSTSMWMPMLPGSHTDLVGALTHDEDLEQIGLKIGEELLTSPNWGVIPLTRLSDVDDENEFRALVSTVWTRDYTAKMNDGGLTGFSQLLIPNCHDEMIRANTPRFSRELNDRLTFVAKNRHDGHFAPWWCGLWWINEERVFWLKDRTTKLEGEITDDDRDGWKTLQLYRGSSVPADTKAPTREPLQTIASVCPVTVPVPTANDVSGTITGTTFNNLTIATGGTHVITWTFEDPSHNVLTLEQTVVVTPENDPPELTTPPDITRTLAASAGAPYVHIDDLGTATAGDACAVVVNLTGVPPGNDFPLGTTTLMYTATDAWGISAVAEQRVTITVDPPAAVDVPTAAGAASCAAVVSEALLTMTPIPGVTIQRSVPANYAFPVGTTTVTYTLSDQAGHTTTTEQTVTVRDGTPPEIVPPAALQIPTVGENCTAIASWNVIATDHCGPVTVVSEPPSGSELPLGKTTIAVTATDLAGNESSASFEVTVLDKTPPILAPLPDISVPAEAGHCDAAVTWDVTTSDSCGDVSVVSTRSRGSRFSVGTTQVVVTATDESGNSTSQTFDVTVTDAEAPSITEASANPAILWSPNHKFVDVAVAYAAGDNCNTATCSLSVSSNEPETGTGDEDFAPDWEIVGPNLVRLRAERAGSGSGRTYTITISCTDDAGNVARRTVSVEVPKSKK